MRVVEAVARRGCCPGVDAVCSSLEWLQLLLLKRVIRRVTFRRSSKTGHIQSPHKSRVTSMDPESAKSSTSPAPGAMTSNASLVSCPATSSASVSTLPSTEVSGEYTVQPIANISIHGPSYTSPDLCRGVASMQCCLSAATVRGGLRQSYIFFLITEGACRGMCLPRLYVHRLSL